MESPPENDLCSVCHSRFNLPCQANCSHWFCGNCILQVWNYGPSLQPCKCPLCRRQITLLIPSDSMSRQHGNAEVSEILNKVERYNRLFGERPNTLGQRMQDLPFLVRRLFRHISDPARTLPFFIRARVYLAAAASLIYVVSPLDIIPEAILGIFGLLDDIIIVLICFLYVASIYRSFLLALHRGMGKPKTRSQSVLRRSQRLLARSGPRRSARLCVLAKSTKTVSESTRFKPSRQCSSSSSSSREHTQEEAPSKPSPRSSRKSSQSNRKIPNFECFDFGEAPITFRNYSDIDSLRRSARKGDALHFWFAYADVYDTIPEGSLNIKERKHILVSNRKIPKEIDESHGMMWVAVRGTDYICAVFRNQEPDMICILESIGRRAIMSYFGKYVLSHMEDIAENSEYQIDGKPFAVVSVAQGTGDADENVYKASRDELDEDKAVEFLMGKIGHRSTLTKRETIKTAIAGFHYLFKETLEPEEIWVTFFHDDGEFDYIMDLDTPEIKEYMDDINKPTSQLPPSRRKRKRKRKCSNQVFHQTEKSVAAINKG